MPKHYTATFGVIEIYFILVSSTFSKYFSNKLYNFHMNKNAIK